MTDDIRRAAAILYRLPLDRDDPGRVTYDACADTSTGTGGQVPGPRATPGYFREAAAAADAAMTHLTAASKRCLDEAQRQSRQLQDNHVGTEHIVLGVLAGDRDIAAMLASAGITETVFRAQLFDEPGPSPDGHIPLTARALMILGLARSAAADDGGAISPRHLMLGVIAESSDWRSRGFDGPHHLDEAAAAAGTSLAMIQSILSRPQRGIGPGG